MGEVNDMKKVISIVMCAVMLLCCSCFAGCGSSNSNITRQDLANALKNNGYEDTYVADENKDHIIGWYVEVAKTKNNIYLDCGRGSEKAPLSDNTIKIYNYLSAENQEDAIKILNIIMPLFDDDFDNAGEDIINHLEELSKDKSNAEKKQILDYSPSYYFSYEYHGLTFKKCTDENFSNEYISIEGTLEAWLEKNNITLEEYSKQIQEYYNN